MHTPVLTKEVIKCLDPKNNENFVDGTVGEGGHALEILKNNGPKGKVLGIDWDPEMIELLRKKDIDRLVPAQGNYKEIESICKRKHFTDVSGVLLDLGLSMRHIKESGRGFTFKGREPLGMRYYPERDLTAKKIVNEWSKKDIEEVLRQYGEEKFAEQIASRVDAIRDKGEIKNNKDLVRVIKEATPSWYHKKRIHPATKSFQALRIAVNRELENLKEGLPNIFEVLDEGGRLVVISYHSLEDRIVKHFVRDVVREGRASALTKKPVRPTEEEVRRNRSSRSARLRAIIKIS